MAWFMWFLTMFIAFWLYRWGFAIMKKDCQDIELKLVIGMSALFLIPYVNVIAGIIFIGIVAGEAGYYDSDVETFVSKVFFLKNEE